MAELDARTAGKLMRAGRDKAEAEITRSIDHPCTVILVAESVQFPGGYAVVHIDGDPAADTREVPLMNGVQVGPGDRALVSYGPPWGAYLGASMRGGDIARARSTNECFDAMGSPLPGPAPAGQVIAGNGVEVIIEVSCSEIEAGGASNTDLTQIIARAGTYAVSLTSVFTSLQRTRTPVATGVLWLIDKDGVDKRLIATSVQEAFHGSFSMAAMAVVADAGDQIEFRVSHKTSRPTDKIEVTHTVLSHIWLAPASDWAKCLCPDPFPNVDTFGIAVDDFGNIYTSHWSAAVYATFPNGGFIKKWDPTGRLLTIWETLLEPDHSTGGSHAGPLAVGGGYLYVGNSDGTYGFIQKYTLDGVYDTAWGGGGYLPPPYLPQEMRYITGVMVAPDGDIWAADGVTHYVTRWTDTGGYISSVGSGNPDPGPYSPYDPYPTDISFPFGMAIGADGFLYVADTHFQCISKWTTDGTFVEIIVRSELWSFANRPQYVRSAKELFFDSSGHFCVSCTGGFKRFETYAAWVWEGFFTPLVWEHPYLDGFPIVSPMCVKNDLVYWANNLINPFVNPVRTVYKNTLTGTLLLQFPC